MRPRTVTKAMLQPVTSGLRSGRFAGVLMAAVAALALLPASAFALTSVSGVLSEDTTWTALDAPYELSGDVVLSPDTRLFIEPGVTILGKGHALEVFGELKAQGIAGDPVLMRDLHLRGRGSYVVGSAVQTFSVEISRADIDGGSLQGGDSAMYGSWDLRRSIVTNIDQPMYLWYPRSDTRIEDNVFVNAGKISAGVHVADTYVLRNVFFRSDFASPVRDACVESWASFNSHKVVVSGNRFLNLGAPTLSLPDWTSSGAIDARGNWWGTTDPAIIEAMIFDDTDSPASPGRIVYAPFIETLAVPSDGLPLTLTNSASRSTGTPGFGAATILSSRVTDSRNAPARGVVLRLERTTDGVTWTPVDTALSGNDGSAAFTVRPTSYIRYRVVSDAVSQVYTESASAVLELKPMAYLSRPAAPTTARRRVNFTTTGYLKTRHRARASSVTLFFYRYERSGSRYIWRLRKRVNAVNSNYSSYTKYTARTSLPYAGRWRVRAYHADADHSRTYSTYDYLRVR